MRPILFCRYSIMQRAILRSCARMDESYDHIVRDVKELAVFRNYIAGNPAKAGLKADEYSLQLWNVLMPN